MKTSGSMGSLNFVGDISYHKKIPRLDLVHHLMGNGRLQAIVQLTENQACRNALVLHLASPERYEARHKSDSFTFHQQAGPELTCVGLYSDGQFYLPNPRQAACDLRCGLVFDDHVPTFSASYPADFTITGLRQKTPFTIEESLFLSIDRPALLRSVRVSNRRGLEPAPARLLAFLVPNQAVFPEAHFVTAAGLAVAGYFEGGDEFLGFVPLTAPDGHMVAEFPRPFDDADNGILADLYPSMDDSEFVRPQETYTNYPLLPGSPHLGPAIAFSFDLGVLEPGQTAAVELAYLYGSGESELLEIAAQLRELGVPGERQKARAYWGGLNQVRTGEQKLDTFFRAVRGGIRAAVGNSGKMNAAIWGYNAEWVRDSSCASLGATMSGQFEMARAMLQHILEELIGPEGMAFGESQFYEPQRAELDQNGELMYALWMYWVHARDDSLIRAHWQKIIKTVEFPLLPHFWVEEVGMFKSERDQRDRDAERHGLRVGFELAHQMWISIAFEKGADMAELMGDHDRASHWRAMAERTWHNALHHPKYRLVENGHLMKRRLLDGTFQRVAKVVPYVHRPDATVMKVYPRNRDRGGELEPDGSEAWPIGKGMIDPNSDLAHRTLLRMESLWNFEWDFGGYPLHHTGSEPTKLGAWPMIFYFVTQAAVEAGEFDTVRRNLDWILSTKDGQGYTWWEYRDADPEYQIDHGIAPWFGYGEPVALFVHHLFGYRPGPDKLEIRPRLLPGMQHASARFRCGAHWVQIEYDHQGPEIDRVQVDGESWPHFDAEKTLLEIPDRDLDVKIWMKRPAGGSSR